MSSCACASGIAHTFGDKSSAAPGAPKVPEVPKASESPESFDDVCGADTLNEECGVFGIWAPGRDVARLTCFALRALQHRGQESAGIAVGDGTTVVIRKDLGLVTQVFSDSDLSAMPGKAAIGHVRYGTCGNCAWDSAQPHLSAIDDVIIALAHNGTLVNCDRLRSELVEKGLSFRSPTDSEVAAQLIGYFTKQSHRLRTGIAETMKMIEGGYAMTLVREEALYAFRDPHGIRPLVIGKIPARPAASVDGGSSPGSDGASVVASPATSAALAAPASSPAPAAPTAVSLPDSSATACPATPEAWVFASETCALDIVGAEYVRDVRPGEIIRVSNEGLSSEQGVKPQAKAECIFEHVYFSRPDSRVGEKSFYSMRYAMGKELAKESPVEADLVIGVPDSGLPPAEGFAHELNLPFGEGFIKNRYVARTFIQPTQELRELGVRLKLNALPDVVAGKRVVMVDDSIVRGTTSSQLVSMLRRAGAKEVHVRINSPEVIWPCFYGIDTDNQKQLISAKKTPEEVCKFIGADSLAFLSVPGLLRCVPAGSYCAACFTGEYPVEIPEEFSRGKFEKGYQPVNLSKASETSKLSISQLLEQNKKPGAKLAQPKEIVF